MSEDELESYQQRNLILDASNLLTQKTYSFHVNVIAKNALNGAIIGEGISNIVSVYINEPAMIRSGSFVITPSCSNQFDDVLKTFSEMFSVTFN